MEPNEALKTLISYLKDVENIEEVQVSIKVIQNALSEVESLHQAYNEQYYQNTTLLNKCLNLEKLNNKMKSEILSLNHKIQFLLQKLEMLEPLRIQDEKKSLTIDVLNLSNRSYNCLKRANIITLEDLASKEENDLLKIRGLGQTNLKEIIEKLHIFLKGDLDA